MQVFKQKSSFFNISLNKIGVVHIIIIPFFFVSLQPINNPLKNLYIQTI